MPAAGLVGRVFGARNPAPEEPIQRMPGLPRAGTPRSGRGCCSCPSQRPPRRCRCRRAPGRVRSARPRSGVASPRPSERPGPPR
eukprot:5283615-Lingulodinium_polyedra.AAC.1